MSSQIQTSEDKVYIYELPVRLWHWLNALALVILAVTGYLISSPLASATGEASDSYLMGTIRFIHFSTAYIFTISFLFRIYWAVVGNEHAKHLFLPPLLTVSFWKGVVNEMLWYAFILKKAPQHEGHNPLALLMMHIVLLWGSVFMMVTGFALYGEGAGHGSWSHSLFTSWVMPLFGDSQAVHSWHQLFMWLLVCFIIVHVYAAVREDKLSKNNFIKRIITGFKE